MKRAIVTPAAPPPSALAELKQWLAITTTQDDQSLLDLLRASAETCEAFTGAMPVACLCEEVLPVRSGWQGLATRPVQSIARVEGLSPTGTRTQLTPTAFEIDLDADGGGLVRLIAPVAATRIVVTFNAGLAPDWDALPETLRHGIMRLAAHQYREREGSGAGPIPPAAVAALWRPWRRLRIA